MKRKIRIKYLYVFFADYMDESKLETVTETSGIHSLATV